MSETVHKVLTDQELGTQVMIDLSSPHEQYRELIERGGLVELADEMALSFGRVDTDFVLRHHELFSSRVEMHMGNERPLIPLNVDPPRHAKYRKLLDPLFAPKRMDEQEPDIVRRANGFIDGFIDRGECNFSEEFADVFPASVFLGLLGLPEKELHMFLHLRDGILHPEKLDASAFGDFEKRLEVQTATSQDVYAYFSSLIAKRKRAPSHDIVTRFLTAEIDGERLTDEEILDICYLFLIAGLDTVSDSLTCFYAHLARNSAARRRMVDQPSGIPAAVEELLRWESPVPAGVPRVATQDVVLPSGHQVKAGTAVCVSYGAANIDPSAFEDPFAVRFDRVDNPHIAFGAGVHRCLGSHLARRELRVTLREWHKRIPDYRIKPGHEKLEYPPGLRHVKDLMLSWGG